jgi:hypothetical protein
MTISAFIEKIQVSRKSYISKQRTGQDMARKTARNYPTTPYDEKT